MKKETIKAFFDNLADNWDAGMVRNEEVINTILATGTLTVAHGMSREKINKHHQGAAKDVSMGLMELEKLTEIFNKYLKVTVSVSNDDMYQVTGKYNTCLGSYI